MILGGLALGWSILAHVVGYVGLTILETPRPVVAAARPQTSELEWVTIDPLPDSPSTESASPDAPLRASRDEQTEDEPETETTPEEEPEPEVPVPPEPEQEQPRPEVPDLSRQAVTQQSADPSVEPPPDAEYIAAENQRVEEETVAEDTSLHSNEALSAPPPPDGEIADGETPNDDPSEDPHEAVAAQEAVAETTTRAPPAASPTPSSATASVSTATRESPRAATVAPPTQLESVTVDDGFGTFTVTRPRATAPRTDPRERGTAGDPTPRAPDLHVGFSSFEQIYGSDALAAQRAEARAQREALAASSGSHRRERMAQYNFAAENFLPTVRPGNQTALNAAASPYAAWIAEVHRKIHDQFAVRFIPRIASQGGPLSNEDLYAEMEFVVDARGRVLRVAITRTSGLSAFDLGAFNAILDAQPLPVPPEAIHSGDGRVYLIWGFSRGPSQCHTMQARPFILPNPPPLVPMPGVTLDEPRRPARFATGDDGEATEGAPAPTPNVVGRGPRRR